MSSSLPILVLAGLTFALMILALRSVGGPRRSHFSSRSCVSSGVARFALITAACSSPLIWIGALIGGLKLAPAEPSSGRAADYPHRRAFLPYRELLVDARRALARGERRTSALA